MQPYDLAEFTKIGIDYRKWLPRKWKPKTCIISGKVEKKTLQVSFWKLSFLDKNPNLSLKTSTKVGCVFPMVVVFILPHVEFGRKDHREDAPHFTPRTKMFSDESWFSFRSSDSPFSHSGRIHLYFQPCSETTVSFSNIWYTWKIWNTCNQFL